MKLTYDEMATAMRRKDSHYNGQFYIGVLSTGIFCIPSWTPYRHGAAKESVLFSFNDFPAMRALDLSDRVRQGVVQLLAIQHIDIGERYGLGRGLGGIDTGSLLRPGKQQGTLTLTFMPAFH